MMENSRKVLETETCGEEVCNTEGDGRHLSVTEAADFDLRMATQVQEEDGCIWHKVPCEGIAVRGLGFYQEEGRWNRLPAELETVLKDKRPAMNLLARHMAGASLRFCTDSRIIRIKADMESAPYMSHMTPAAQCGFDCYIRKSPEDNWHLTGISKFPVEQNRINCLLAGELPGDRVEVCVNLPLYTGVLSLEVGLLPEAHLLPPEKPTYPVSLAFYGTSITQGGCASRSGMAYPSLIGRRLNAEVYNMGFSGNGVGMPELAEAFCRLKGLGILVVDIESNAGPEGLLKENLPVFLDAIRRNAPELPILVLSASYQCMQAWKEEFAGERRSWRQIQQEEVSGRRSRGDTHIYYEDAQELIGEAGAEATVDGVHLTDLGFYILADKLVPILKELR